MITTGQQWSGAGPTASPVPSEPVGKLRRMFTTPCKKKVPPTYTLLPSPYASTDTTSVSTAMTYFYNGNSLVTGLFKRGHAGGVQAIGEMITRKRDTYRESMSMRY